MGAAHQNTGTQEGTLKVEEDPELQDEGEGGGEKVRAPRVSGQWDNRGTGGTSAVRVCQPSK